MMKKQVLTSLLVLSVIAVYVFAGSLEPAGSPGPTMKTLDEVEARIPIPGSETAAGIFTVPQSGSYYLTGNRICGSTGIVIATKKHVKIDLNGYSLTGAEANTSSGILLMAENHNIEIRNGTIEKFGQYGIYAQLASNRAIKIINVHVEENGLYVNSSGIEVGGYGNMIKDCTATNNNGKGIRCGTNATVSNCSVSDNLFDGIDAGNGSRVFGCVANNNQGVGIGAGVGATIFNCSAYSNGNDGIGVTGKSVISNCSSSYNKDVGIRAGTESTVQNCVVTYSDNKGIFASGNCIITGNSVSYSGQVGNYAGIRVLGTGNRVEANHVSYNPYGIKVDNPANSFIIKNTAFGNILNDYDGVFAGQIATDPATAGPWQNLKF